jgi:transcriptional regulator with PAS, ATPase and Fis domain
LKKSMNLVDGAAGLGFLEFDLSGRLVKISSDFCDHFSVNQNDLLGAPIHEMIQDLNYRKQKNVCFGKILGYSCLLRAEERDTRIFYILVRHDEIEYSDMVSFVNSISKLKKKSNRPNRYGFDEIIGESYSIKQIKELAARIATSNSTVLLTGESGTGKELFAQAIHGLSARKHHPFVAVNCAAIPDELFESELFGYEAGAFSGAKKDGKPGKIELAQHGTLFLDEISELPLQAQGKLLRVLQEREVERLGGTGSKYVDIRIITATNRDLKTLVNEGKFRQDLFYRLYVFDLKIPSLRQRKDDILPLAHYFIDYFNEEFGLQVKYIDPNLQKWLLEYEWPGNIRELKAFIERGMNIVEGDTLRQTPFFAASPENFTSSSQDYSPVKTLKDEVENAEIHAIQRALQETGGDRSTAAQLLNIHIASLYRKIAKYKIQ